MSRIDQLDSNMKTRDAEGITKLSLVPGKDLLGDDGEATVDGVHPTDVGFLRMANIIGPAVETALKQRGAK